MERSVIALRPLGRALRLALTFLTSRFVHVKNLDGNVPDIAHMDELVGLDHLPDGGIQQPPAHQLHELFSLKLGFVEPVFAREETRANFGSTDQS